MPSETGIRASRRQSSNVAGVAYTYAHMKRPAKRATTKKAGLHEFVTAMKADLRYAESTVKFDNDKPMLISRSGREYACIFCLPKS